MTSANMLRMLRRRLNERTTDNWEDDELYEALGAGLLQVQKEVIKVDPVAFMFISQAPLQADREWYPLPPDFWYELEVGIKTSATDTRYTALTRGAYDRDKSRSGSSDRVYDIRGRFITFMAIPDYSVDPGYQLQYTPSLSLAHVGVAGARGPTLHEGLHVAVPLWAHLILMGETHESASETASLLKAILNDIPEWYKKGGEAPRLRIDAGGPYYRAR